MTRWRKSVVGDFACLDGYGKALEPVRKPAWDRMPVGVPQDTKIA